MKFVGLESLAVNWSKSTKMAMSVECYGQYRRNMGGFQVTMDLPRLNLSFGMGQDAYAYGSTFSNLLGSL